MSCASLNWPNRSWRNVDCATSGLIRGDAQSTGLPRAAYDLVHERLLLTIVRQPETVVTEMSELVRPGGIVALEDVVCHSWACAPPHPAWTQLFRAWQAVIQTYGNDGDIGHRLPGFVAGGGVGECLHQGAGPCNR